MLNYKHLHYFFAVARAGGINRAAESLHLAPQTLSAQIAQLENRLGVALFSRTGRRMEITDAGKLALSYAQEIFATGAELEDVMRRGANGCFVTFSVGMADVIPKLIAHRLLAPVLERADPVRLVCREDRLDRLLADMVGHRLDMVLSDRPVPPSLELKVYSHLLGESPIAFVAAPRLVNTLRDTFPQCLQNAPLLLPGQDSTLHTSVPRWLERQGIKMRTLGEFDDSATMKAFGEDGAGVFPVAAANLPDIIKHYDLIPLGETDEIRERFFLLSAQRRLTHPVTQSVWEHARGSNLFPARIPQRQADPRQGMRPRTPGEE